MKKLLKDIFSITGSLFFEATPLLTIRAHGIPLTQFLQEKKFKIGKYIENQQRLQKYLLVRYGLMFQYDLSMIPFLLLQSMLQELLDGSHQYGTISLLDEEIIVKYGCQHTSCFLPDEDKFKGLESLFLHMKVTTPKNGKYTLRASSNQNEYFIEKDGVTILQHKLPYIQKQTLKRIYISPFVKEGKIYMYKSTHVIADVEDRKVVKVSINMEFNAMDYTMKTKVFYINHKYIEGLC